MKYRIISESLKVLIFGSLLSSIGGLSLELIKTKLSAALPMIIILPALTDMIGDAGTIVVSKITTYLKYPANCINISHLYLGAMNIFGKCTTILFT